jgi:hypothetical protein
VAFGQRLICLGSCGKHIPKMKAGEAMGEVY